VRRAAAFALLMLLSAGGCAPRPSASSPRVVRMAIGVEPRTLNPIFSTLLVENEVSEALFQGLVRIGPGTALLPDLARAVPSRANGGISADGRTYTYRLREDARWSDGVPVTAADVVFTYGALIDRHLDVPNSEIAALVASLRAPDAHTLVIRLRHPSSEATRILFCNGRHGSILPAHVLRGVDLAHATFDRHPIGSGPFVLERWDAGAEIRLAARRDLAPRAGIDELRLLVIPAPTTVAAELRTGALDYARIAADVDPRLLGERVVQGTLRGRTLIFLTFQTRRAPFTDARVRRALAAALDVPRIARTATAGRTVPATTLVAPYESGYATPADVVRFDADAARRILAPRHLAIVLALPAGAPPLDRRAAQIAAAWERAGVRVQLRPLAPGVLFGEPGPLYDGHYDVALMSWTFEAGPDRSEMLASSEAVPNGENFALFRDADVDRWCLQAVEAADPRLRAVARARIATRVARDVPYLPLDWPLGRFAHARRLHGVEPQPGSNDLWNVRDWRLGSDDA
jgi:peptide/nickel transport system substrate-binding protein